MLAVRDFLTNFHIGAASGWDVFIVLVFLIAVMVYGLFIGRNRMVVISISSYFSFLIVQNIPWWKLNSFNWLGIEDGPSTSLKINSFF